MHTFLRKRIKVYRHRTHKRLAFAGFHLRDSSAMEYHSTNKLHIKRNHIPYKFLRAYPNGFPPNQGASPTHQRKGLRQEIIKRRTRGNAVAEFLGFARDCVKSKTLECLRLLPPADHRNQPADSPELFLIRIPE